MNSILSEIIALVALLDLSILYSRIIRPDGMFEGISFLSFNLLLLFFMALLLLSRVGKSGIASYALIFSLLASAAFSSYSWGVELPAALMTYAFVVLIATILIGERFALTLLISIAVWLVYLSAAESATHLIAKWQCRPTHIVSGFQNAVMLAFIGGLGLLYRQDIEQSLRRARNSEQKLKEERDSLEAKVNARSDELKLAQADKMSQLYRFAEFGRLSSGLFHDLVGPLFTVALNIENLGASLHPDLPAIKNHLELSLRASKKMERFITTVKRQIQLTDLQENFMLNESVEDVIALLNYKAVKAGVYLEFRADERIYAFQSPLKFQQIVSNLVANAIDSYEGSLRNSGRKSVVIELSQKNGMIELAVTDKGMEYQPAL